MAPLKKYAVLIPTKGRPRSLQRLFESCPMLNAPSTFIGTDENEPEETWEAYARVLNTVAKRASAFTISNPDGYTSVARERLRAAAVRGKYPRYVLSDDNCKFTDESLTNLLRAQEVWEGSIMAGGHPTAKHFHADQIFATGETREGSSSYSQVGMIFWVVPHSLYKDYRYPEDCYFDDVHFILWCLSKGFTDFRSTLDAPFDKHLHEPGGTGTIAERIRKRGIGFARLATDFPQWMTKSILQTRVPYKDILKAVHEGRKGFD